MSLPNEVQVGTSVCLDAVTDAFRNGEAIIEKIKRNRARKRAPPPPRLLEDSISQAPAEIEREKKRGIIRFGKAFEDGDHIAVIALQQITIDLQNSLLDKLKNAAFDDDSKITDFTYLVDAADTGRDRTIAALHDLRQRLISARQPQQEPLHSEQAQSPSSANSSASNVSIPPTINESNPPAASSLDEKKSQLGKPKTWAQDVTTSRDASGEEDAVTGAEPATKEHHRKGSLLGFLKHRRTQSTSEVKEAKDKTYTSQPITEENASPKLVPFRPPQKCDASNDATSTSDSTQPGAPRFHYDDYEGSQADGWNDRLSLDRHQSVTSVGDQQSVRTGSIATINMPFHSSSPVQATRTNSNPQNFAGSIVVPIPNPDNDYLGFCKCAVKLQNGDRKSSMHKVKEVEAWSRHPSSHASAPQYLACQQQKCAFRSSFSNKDVEVIWKRVFNLEAKGMKVRWQFLAKSHVLQKVVVKHQYSFKCLFCIFMNSKSAIYHGGDAYLDHIAAEHRSQPLNDVILYKTGCINDRVASDEDDFDINVWPASALAGAPAEKNQPDWLSDDVMNPVKEANDSMFNEPWNEGLSDFHYGGGQFEEAEYLRD